MIKSNTIVSVRDPVDQTQEPSATEIRVNDDVSVADQVDSRREVVAKLIGGAFGFGLLATACDPPGDRQAAPIENEVDQTIQGLSNTAFRWVDTIADLRSYGGSSTIHSVIMGGYWSVGDGGGGVFHWDSVSVEADNHGTIVKPTNVTTGRWRRIYDGVINVKWFGARGTNAYGSANDDGIAIRRAIDLVTITTSEGTTNRGRTIFFPRGDYRIESSSNAMILPRLNYYGGGLHFKGEGADNTRIYGVWAGATGNDALVRFAPGTEVAIDYSFQDLSLVRTEFGPVFHFAGSGQFDRLRGIVFRNANIAGRQWVPGSMEQASTLSLSNVFEMIMENVKVEGNLTGLYLNGFSRCVVERAAFPFNDRRSGRGVVLENGVSGGGSGDIVFISPWFSKMAASSIAFSAIGSDGLEPILNITIINPSFEGGDNGKSYLYFKNVRGVQVLGGSLGSPNTTLETLTFPKRGFWVASGCSEIHVDGTRIGNAYTQMHPTLSHSVYVEDGAKNISFSNMKLGNLTSSSINFPVESDVFFGSNVDAFFEGRTYDGSRQRKVSAVIPNATTNVIDANPSDVVISKYNGIAPNQPISLISNGYDNQVLTVLFEVGASLVESGNISLASGTAYTALSGTVMRFTRIRNGATLKWYEISRSAS